MTTMEIGKQLVELGRRAARHVITQKATNKRMTMDEIALYTIANGKIVREEFFYAMG